MYNGIASVSQLEKSGLLKETRNIVNMREHCDQYRWFLSSGCIALSLFFPTWCILPYMLGCDLAVTQLLNFYMLWLDHS